MQVKLKKERKVISFILKYKKKAMSRKNAKESQPLKHEAKENIKESSRQLK